STAARVFQSADIRQNSSVFADILPALSSFQYAVLY
ncbi:MAG: hypothetical protein ACI96P_002380, partial [Candidatus Azotimanducaceae bacterium]